MDIETSKEYIKTLINVGLSETESRIYVSLIAKSHLSISEISKAVGIKRPTCYLYIDEMLRKNLIIRVPIGKKFHYSAVQPKKLLNNLKKNFENFELSIPEMEELYSNSSGNTRVQFYEGKPGIRNIYKESFETIGEAFSIFPADEYLKQYTFSEFAENEKIIQDTKFKSKDLIISDKNFKLIDDFLTGQKNTSKVYKRLNNGFKTSVDVLIYGDKVALITLKSLSAIVIDNREISDLFKSIHVHLWKNSK